MYYQEDITEMSTQEDMDCSTKEDKFVRRDAIKVHCTVCFITTKLGPTSTLRSPEAKGNLREGTSA
jgi:hypothetical protein